MSTADSLEIFVQCLKKAPDRVCEELGIPGCRSLLRLDKEVRRKEELPIFETTIL